MSDGSTSTQRRVLVTGASTGIGRACALALADRGWRVFAGYRSAEDGEALAAAGGEGLTPLRLDVAEQESIASARARLCAGADGSMRLDGLLNNAGIAVAAPLELVPREAFRKQLEVNLTGVLAVTQAFLPSLRQARGRVVNMSSIAGRVASPFLGAYAVSKFGLEAMSDALRQEVAPQGIAVAVVEPGAVDTPIWSKSLDAADELARGADPELLSLYEHQAERAREIGRRSARAAIDVRHVVKAVLHALEARRPRTRYLVGRDAWAGALLRRVLTDRMMDRILR